MELLEVSCESGGPGGAVLEAGGAHRWHPKGGHGACAEYHIEEETGTMMSTNSLRDSKVNHCARLSAYRSSVILVNVNEPGRRCVRPLCACMQAYVSMLIIWIFVNGSMILKNKIPFYHPAGIFKDAFIQMFQTTFLACDKKPQNNQSIRVALLD